MVYGVVYIAVYGVYIAVCMACGGQSGVYRGVWDGVHGMLSQTTKSNTTLL